MGFAGNLNTLSLVEVFQTINRIRATGVLRLAAAESGREVIFSEGEIIGVGFRAGEEKLSLLRRLILEGRIDAATAASISSSRHDSASVLEALIQRQIISETDVLDALHRQAEDELYNLCSWDFADFIFQDATADDQTVVQQVAACKARPLQMNINSLLMETARRIDEWANLQQVIKSEDAVLGPANEREQDLLSASQEYPGSAVVPLIDAVRTIETIIADSVATRLDVYGVLAELITNGLVAVLAREDILAHADYQFSQRDYIKSAQLYRRALSEDPTDQNTTAKLADCLQLLGEAPEAASCFSQLALGYLDKGSQAEAISSAHRAIRLNSEDPKLRLILVRCLLDDGKTAEAVTELRTVAARFITLGQLEDARGTCLKILELDPTNEDTRREMARIFSTAEQNANSEDVIICVQCGHTNHREGKVCAECEAPLRLSCQSCGRTVAVSDRLCIFCGANPHITNQKRKLMASPSTTSIVNKGAKEAAKKKEKGSQFWANKLESSVKQARALEEASDYAGALTAWREIGKLNPDNKELLGHIRELEGRVNDDLAERLIDRGHQLRRVRRFHAAMKAYRSAIRSMPEADPRIPRLNEILVSTQKHHQRIMVIYVAAFMAIGVFGWLVARPYVLLHTFRGDLETASRLLTSVPGGTSPATFDALAQVAAEADRLETQSKRLGNSTPATEANINLNDFRAQLFEARKKVAESAVQEIAAMAINGDIVRADQLIQQLRAPEYQAYVGPRLKISEDKISETRRRLNDMTSQRKLAPERFEELKTLEQNSKLGVALGGYRQLAGIGHDTISPSAKEAVARLEPLEQAFVAALAQAHDQQSKDLAKTNAALSAIERDAKAWGRDAEWNNVRDEVAKRIQQAAIDYQQLGLSPTAEVLSAFISKHPASAQAAQAKVRLDLFAQASRSRDAQMAAWQAAMKGNQTEEAWRIARNLFSSGSELPAELRLPLRIETTPAGAQVSLNGTVVGTTPCVIGVLPNQVDLDLRLTMDGWQPMVRKVNEVVGEWRWQAAMMHTARWQVNLGKPINSVMVLPDGGVLALSGEVLNRLSNDGKSLWRTSIAAVDELSDLNHFRLAHLPQFLNDGSLVLGLPLKDVAIISPKGAIDARLPSIAATRGRPQIFTNDLMGGQPRLAYAAEALYRGDLGSELSRIVLPSPALSGPLIFAKGPDRILVVATVQGQLLAFEDSTKKTLWQFDLKATEIGQLIPLGVDTAMAVLDGSRVASWQITPNGATLRWNAQLPGPAVGDPSIVGDTAWIAAGSALIKLSKDGVATTVPLPSPAITPAFASGDLVVVGVRSGQVLVFKRGVLLWSTHCDALPGGVACTGDVVVVGMADGTLVTYSP
jgi:tetratricopeptide (TPR) repeat protein